MSRKSFSNLTRQGKWKRIKKTIRLENVHEQGSSYNEKEPKQGTSYSENEFQQSTFYNENSHHSGQTYIPQYQTENNKNFTQDQLQWESYFLESSDESDADTWTAYSDNEKVLESLRTLSVQFNITNVALSALLCIWRTHKCFDLPLDARSLLKTPSDVEVQPVAPGDYYHFGLQNGLERLLCSIKEMITSVELLVGIDGLPLFNSSAGELWPILVSILNVPTINSMVIPVGIYFGKKRILQNIDSAGGTRICSTPSSIRSGSSAFSDSDRTLLGQVQATLRAVAEKLDILHHKVNILMANQESGTIAEPSCNDSLLGLLPLENLEDFNALEEQTKENTNFANQLVNSNL